MHRVLILGAGKIGSLIAVLLSESKDYKIFLGDNNPNNAYLKNLSHKSGVEIIPLDAKKPEEVATFLKKNPVESVVSSLPYYCNSAVAKIAKEFDLNYFDLTEDTETANAVTELAKHSKKAFVPQCGLAPGFISIVTNELMKPFSGLDTVKMRVGALPINISNALQYTLTWSTDGLINEYGNLCYGIENGNEVTSLPLDDLEEIKIDGLTYEAFNTSGGIGSLAKSYIGKVKHLSYKTIRYPGHCAKMRFLMNDLKLNENRETLKNILEKAIPQTGQDVVLVYSSVTGMKNQQYTEENYVRKFYPKKIQGHAWSAIQLTTATELVSVLDMVVTQAGKYKGFVKQEQFSLDELTANRFGQYYV